MNELIGGFGQLGWVAAKALLLYLTAVFGFRLGEQRTLAEMSAFDFVAAVAVGAIVGRVPNASTTSYVEGAATLITVLVVHGIIARLRHFPTLATLFDHPPRVLVSRGKILEAELRRAGLTKDDVYGLLRQQGVLNLEDAHLVIFEQRGQVSVIRSKDLHEPDPALLRDVK